jgi:hypothetical protein
VEAIDVMRALLERRVTEARGNLGYAHHMVSVRSEELNILQGALRALDQVVALDAGELLDRVIVTTQDTLNLSRSASDEAHAQDSPTSFVTPAAEVPKRLGLTNTAQLVAAVVSASDRPLRMGEVKQGLADRGWIKDEWTNPDATIYAALRRATQAKLIQKLGRTYSKIEPTSEPAALDGAASTEGDEEDSDT